MKNGSLFHGVAGREWARGRDREPEARAQDERHGGTHGEALEVREGLEVLYPCQGLDKEGPLAVEVAVRGGRELPLDARPLGEVGVDGPAVHLVL